MQVYYLCNYLNIIISIHYSTFAGVGSSLPFPKKSADSQTGPTTSKVAISAFAGAGETSSICCRKKKNNVKTFTEKKTGTNEAALV
jgi:hypothetical protein